MSEEWNERENNQNGNWGNGNSTTGTYSAPETGSTTGTYSAPVTGSTAGTYSAPESTPIYGEPEPAYNSQQMNQSQNTGDTYNYGGQQSYYDYQAASNSKKDTEGMGIASLVLGILSLLLFCCCINYVLAIIAIILGIIQLVTSNKKGMAIAGIITGAISIVVSIIFWVVMSYSTVQEEGGWEKFLEEAGNPSYYYEDDMGNSFDYDME